MKNKQIASLILNGLGLILVGMLAIILSYSDGVRNSTTKAEIQQENLIQESKENENQNWIAVNSGEEKITPNTVICFYTVYLGCGHTTEEEGRAEGEEVNLTKEEIQTKYSEWKMLEFNTKRIIFQRNIEGECGEHFEIKEQNGKICIYQVPVDGDAILWKETEIETQYLPELDQKSLKKGVSIIGKEQLNYYIENFES